MSRNVYNQKHRKSGAYFDSDLKNLLEERFEEVFRKRRQVIQMLAKAAEKELESAPEGTLRICSRSGRTQYYYREKPSDHQGRYIPAKDAKLVSALAQKSYNQKLLKSAYKEIRAIDHYLRCAPGLTIPEIFESLNANRKKLLTPAFEPDEAFLRRWVGTEYTGGSFSDEVPEFYTDRGERVRSKSEVLIANALASAGIPYRYEYPLLLKGAGEVYPDFTVLDRKRRKEIYWEHLGMMDRLDYVERNIKKIGSYISNDIFPGDKLVLTFETQVVPLSTRQIQAVIDHYFGDKAEKSS